MAATEATPAGQETPTPAVPAAATTGKEGAAPPAPPAGHSEAKAPEGSKAAEPPPDATKTGDAPPPADAPKPGAPAKYELQLPADALLIDADVKRIEKMGREANLTNDDVQGLVEAQNAIMVEQSTAWRAELEADPDYGGEKLAEHERIANLLLEKVRPKGTARGDGIRRVLAQGYGNHLEFVSLLADLGRGMLEDSEIRGEVKGQPTQGGKTTAQIMYPNAKS